MSRQRVPVKPVVPIVGNQAVRGRRPSTVTASGRPALNYNLVYDYMNNEGNDSTRNPFISGIVPFRPEFDTNNNTERYIRLRDRILLLEGRIRRTYTLPNVPFDYNRLLVTMGRTGGGYGPIANPAYYTEVNRINEFLEERRRDIEELRRLNTEVARIVEEENRIELEILRGNLIDPYVLAIWYIAQFGVNADRRNQRRNTVNIQEIIREQTGYIMDENGYDYLDISPESTMNRILRNVIITNPRSYMTNLIITRNLLAARNLFVPGVMLFPRVRVTMTFDLITGGQRTEDVIMGEEARNRLYANQEELIEVGRNRVERLIQETEGERRENLEELLETLNEGGVPDILTEGFISNVNKIKIMLDVYRQLMNERAVIAELYVITDESSERDENDTTYIVTRPNTYLEEREEVRLYGFWPYKVPENNFNFNVNDDCYCVVTSLTMNDRFPIKYNIRNISELVAYIYYCCGVELYDKGLINKIYQVHGKISNIFNLPMVVEYYEYVKNGINNKGKQKYSWKAHRRRYPSAEVIRKRDILEDELVFKVLISRGKLGCDHIFNVNSEEALAFLKEYIRTGEKEYRDGYGDLEYRGKSEIYWSDALVRMYKKQIEKDPVNLFRQLVISHEGDILNCQEPEEIDNTDYIKISDIANEIEREKAEMCVKYNIYCCLDFEGADITPYSMSWNYFYNEGQFERQRDKSCRNITADNVKREITEADIRLMLDDGIKMCRSIKTDTCYILIHNGGRYDFPALMENKLMKCEGVEMLNPLRAGNGLIDLLIRYKGFNFRIRDSYRMTGASLNDLVKLLGVKTGKTKYMYCLYNEEYVKPAEQRKLVWTLNELYEKMEIVDENYREEISGFLREYNEGRIAMRETYDLKAICVEYCNNDVEVLRNCMIRYMSAQHDDRVLTHGSVSSDAIAKTFKGLSKEYVRRVVKEEEDGEIETSYIGNISPIENLSLTNHTKKIAKSEGCFNGAYKMTDALHDYLKQFVRGGRVWLPRNKKFISNVIRRILDNPYFYIDDNNLSEFFARKHGYDINKEKLHYNPANPPEQVLELKQDMRRFGSCIIDLDAVSLYPSAIVGLKYFPTGTAKVLTNEVFMNTRREREIMEDEPIWFGYFNITRTLKDRVLTEIDGEYFEFPLFTKKDKGKTVKIDMIEKNYPMNLIDYKEMIYYYPDAKIELVNGVMFTEKSTNFSEFIKKLYGKRAFYKILKKAKLPEGDTEGIIKIMLNSAYGDMIRKKVLQETKYASIHSYRMIQKKICKKIKKLTNNDISNLVSVRTNIINTNPRMKEFTREIVRIINELNNSGEYETVHFTKLNINNQIGKMGMDVVSRLSEKYKLNDVEMIRREQVGVETYGLAIDSTNITHRMTYNKKVKHATKPHWGALILSYSKAIMNRNTEAVGFKVYYTDTDSLHVDGSHVLNDTVKQTLDPENPNVPELSMGKMHSDFNAWEPVKGNNNFFVTPLDKEIGLCSIHTTIVDKKFYRDIVLGVINEKVGNEIRSYIGINKHCRCKGMKAEIITEDQWDDVITGETNIRMDLLLYKAMSIYQNNKTGEVVVKTRYNGHEMFREIKGKTQEPAKPITIEIRRQLTLNII